MSPERYGFAIESILEAVRRTHTRELTMAELARFIKATIQTVIEPDITESETEKRSHVQSGGTG